MRILFTGGTGTLGKALFPILSKAGHTLWTPAREELNILNREDWRRAFAVFQPELVVHAAAFTAVEQAEKNRELCWRVNVEGTKLGLFEAKQDRIRFVLFSTDYVFDGKQEADSVGYDVDAYKAPVNHYGLTKFAADLLTQEYEFGAVIRTSFAANGRWRYPRAFDDLWTGKDYIQNLAPALATAVETPFVGVVHIVTERKTVYELARRTNPDVEPVSRLSVEQNGLVLPKDVTLNTKSWEFVRRNWQKVNHSVEHTS